MASRHGKGRSIIGSFARDWRVSGADIVGCRMIWQELEFRREPIEQ
jgi:hypothetical protein